ncbi:glycoside hydrolase family 24 [Crinalium epipsammum PCC 9333]|uniref:Glycoside hydrolase family 24 n=1 Tax=Crinalium epipsammum PCC 9333 TaxID=1173022 RepID=K9VT36_9CYAN|nr:glycoside hydrolase family 104 protein [Crinalium epipsammum]AFZ11233.1 glycoside hydrolase family 24 [Crinalium epipsammum PCC 9333]
MTISLVLQKAIKASTLASTAFSLLVLSSGILPKAIAQTVYEAPITATSAAPSVQVIPVPQTEYPQNSSFYSAPNSTDSRLTTPEVRAFLDVISMAETGTIDPSSYSILVFNGSFSDFSTHPKVKQCSAIRGRRICSTAAGRYQIMDFNWDYLAPKLGLPDFSPESQDRMALYFIERKGAMADILAGRFEKAACKVGTVWASIPPPCNRYGQSRHKMAQLRQMYDQRLRFYSEGQ